ncbi:MAG: thiamine phosphate synthase, partial [Gemmatimonadetes bacterium]|nr:thiamine phosphate synthase [Gemmatimonadota bacterium]
GASCRPIPGGGSRLRPETAWCGSPKSSRPENVAWKRPRGSGAGDRVSGIASSNGVQVESTTDLPRLHVIAGDGIISAADYRERIGPVLRVGGRSIAVHLRARTVHAARLFEVACWLAESARATGSLAVVNDRLDVALAAGAGGIHLREDSLAPEDVRQVAGRVAVDARGLRVGRSIHETRQAAMHPADLLDYLVLGTVYATPSHPEREPLGLPALAETVRLAGVPVLAIGGVVPATLPYVLARGAYGAVVLSGVWAADRPSEAVSRYLEVLDREAAP